MVPRIIGTVKMLRSDYRTYHVRRVCRKIRKSVTSSYNNYKDYLKLSSLRDYR